MATNEKDGLGIYLEFTDRGFLRAVYFYSETDQGFITLRRALDRLLRPDHLGWVKRLFLRK